MDKRMEERINELIGQMTLEEKVALTEGQDIWTTMPLERLGIPSIFLNDGPHGVRRPHSGSSINLDDAKEATCFPTASTLASTWDTALISQVGKALAAECHALDVQILLGPGLNIKRSPLGGRNFEYYAEDPYLTAEMGLAFVKAVQAEGIGTSLKHYACNDQEYERMTINAVVDERTLREVHLYAFERVVKEAHPWTVMAAYNMVNGVPATEHTYLLTEILKREWGFDGLVVSDWSAINYKEKALAAGLDLEMPGKGGVGDAKIARMVRDGLLSQATLDEAVRRILRIVLRATANKREGVTFTREAHHALARQVAGEGAVLLKNEGNLLPLETRGLRSLAVIGHFARAPRYQGGGSSQVNPTRIETAYDEIAKIVDGKVKITYARGYPDQGADNEALLREAVATAREAQVAIIFAGLAGSFDCEGYDRADIDMPPAHNHLIDEVCRVQPNTVVVLANGSAVSMPWVKKPKAILESWLGGQASGGAVADILFGLVNPSGKLSETFPRRVEDTPAYLNFPGEAGTVRYGEGLFVGYKHYDKKKIEPMFPFGFGLSYTSFAYSDLALSTEKMTDRDTLAVSLKITNTGKVAGKEVVQLYLRDEESSVQRPVKELKSFAKVSLEPGETKTVGFTLAERDFAYYDSAARTWCVESGWFEILIGASSADIRLSAKVYIHSTRRLKKHFHELVPFKDFFDHPTANEVVREMLGEVPLIALFFSGALDAMHQHMLGQLPILRVVRNFTGGAVTDEVLSELLNRINERQ